MRTKFLSLCRWFIHRLPEVLLVCFLLSLLPLVVFVAEEAVAQATAAWKVPGEYFQSVVDDPVPALAVVACVLGTAVLLFVLWRNWGLIWAVARKMIVEGLHRKVVLVLLVFFVLLVLSLPFLLKTEGSVKSQVQIVLLYSLIVAMVLLSLVAIFVSAASICSEIERKHVQITDTKPLRRWQFLLGKWFGTLVMCAAVLFVMAGATYALVFYLARPPDYSRMTAREAEKARQEYEGLFEEILCARRSAKSLLPPGVDEAVEESLRVLKARGDLPDSRRERKRLREDLWRAHVLLALTAPPGGVVYWKIRGLKPGGDGALSVRFKGYVNTPGGRLLGRWVVWVKRPMKLESGETQERLRRVFRVVSPEGGWHADTRWAIAVPEQCVGEDGTLYLTYENMNPDESAGFDPELLVEVLQEDKTFFPNYYRSLVVVLCHVALLAALGLMAGSVFSFPVACLVVVFFFVIGLMGPWLAHFIELSRFADYTQFEEYIWMGLHGSLKAFLSVMPHFGKYNPLGDLTDGKLIPWSAVFRAGAVMLYVKGGAALLIGMYFYARRELARVIV